MSMRGRALAAVVIAVACWPSCRSGSRNRGGGKTGPAAAGGAAAHEGGHGSDRGQVGADDGVVFFPAGSIERLKQKGAKLATVRTRLDAAIAHARKELSTKPDALSDIKSEGRWPERFPMVHVKDSGGAPDHRMLDVGAGSIPWKAILARREQAGIRHYFVEHDEPEDPLGSVRRSYEYLRGLDV
jgi:hypothetical protein